jgi:hypothetical protein
MKNPSLVLTVALVLALLGFGAWHWRDALWSTTPAGAPAAAASAAAPAAAASVAVAPAPAAAPASGPPRHPIEAAGSGQGATTGTPTETAPPTLASTLAQLLGAEAMATIVVGDDFARRVVATVDNLGREKAPARLWPLSPPAGRFTTQRDGDAEVLAAANFARYARHLALIQGLDLRRAVALYKRFYPQFQQAYEELGYPGRHFNDRVVEVIDLLLATPEPSGPVTVQQRAITGPIQPERPWLLYEFTDPERQAAPAGAQLLLRMGPDNRRAVKAKLTELRRLLVRG